MHSLPTCEGGGESESESNGEGEGYGLERRKRDGPGGPHGSCDAVAVEMEVAQEASEGRGVAERPFVNPFVPVVPKAKPLAGKRQALGSCESLAKGLKGAKAKEYERLAKALEVMRRSHEKIKTSGTERQPPVKQEVRNSASSSSGAPAPAADTPKVRASAVVDVEAGRDRSHVCQVYTYTPNTHVRHLCADETSELAIRKTGAAADGPASARPTAEARCIRSIQTCGTQLCGLMRTTSV